jgi:acetyl-CoA carboxylase carboxyl transferase subunit alpha
LTICFAHAADNTDALKAYVDERIAALDLTAIERVQLARHPKRPYTLDYVERIFTDFMELHGDRAVPEGRRGAP